MDSEHRRGCCSGSHFNTEFITIERIQNPNFQTQISSFFLQHNRSENDPNSGRNETPKSPKLKIPNWNKGEQQTNNGCIPLEADNCAFSCFCLASASLLEGVVAAGAGIGLGFGCGRIAGVSSQVKCFQQRMKVTCCGGLCRVTCFSRGSGELLSRFLSVVKNDR